MRTALVFLFFLAVPACLGNPKFKKPPVRLFGLHGMRYLPLVPYNFLGLNPVLLRGSGLNPRPAVVKEKSPDGPAPYVPQYSDMEKLNGYEGLLMPGLNPRPAVVKEKSPDGPAPYVPQYGDMEKMIGYGGLPMPYGGYGYPFLYGYSDDIK